MSTRWIAFSIRIRFSTYFPLMTLQESNKTDLRFSHGITFSSVHFTIPWKTLFESHLMTFKLIRWSTATKPHSSLKYDTKIVRIWSLALFVDSSALREKLWVLNCWNMLSWRVFATPCLVLYDAVVPSIFNEPNAFLSSAKFLAMSISLGTIEKDKEFSAANVNT